MNTFEHLWNGWRAAYVQGSGSSGTAAGSVFTQLLNSGLSDNETHIVHRGERCFAILNVYPYSTGHVLIVPYAERPALDDLDADESGELWSTVTDAVTAIRTAYRPDGINVGVNMGQAAGGSISEHLHVHVLPRWVGDSNFMTAVANTRTLPEALDATADKIRAAWPTGH